MSIIRKHRHKILATLGFASIFGSQTTAFAEESIGHLDVTVNTQPLLDAISKAESAGVIINRESTEVQTGNATEVAKFTKDAETYYANKVTELNNTVTKYKADLAKYEQDVAKANSDADTANAKMEGYRTSLAALGKTISVSSVTYSDANLNSASSTIDSAIEKSRTYHSIEDAIDSYNVLQNSLTNFQTQDAQGTIRIERQTVKVSSVAEIEQYKQRIQDSYQQMNTYVNGIGSNPGAVQSRPTYTLYNIVMTDALINEQASPVVVPNFIPITVQKVATPQVSYKFFDIRQQSDIDNGITNNDKETIVATPTSNGEVHQAMVNQTVKVTTTTDPLPSGRFDKYHSLVFSYTIPTGVDVLEQTFNKSHYNYEYDESRNMVYFRATDDYLLEINRNQITRDGTNAGVVSGQFALDIPALTVKLKNDDTTYSFNASVLVNHEHKVKSDDILVRTSSASPVKTNKDANGVVIDGKSTWAGDINNFTLTWDFDQYKGVNIDRKMQEAGLYLHDFYPSEAVTLSNPIVIRYNKEIIATGQADGSFKDKNGTTINGVRWFTSSGVDGIDRKGEVVSIGITGYDHPWYKQYVETGKQLEVTIPMITKVVDSTPDVDGGYYGGVSYKNIAYQSDLGNIYRSNEVTNSIVKVDPRKDAVASIANLTSLDLKNNPSATIAQGDYFQYRGQSTLVPKDATGPKSYAIADTFHSADEYYGSYFAEMNGLITFKPNTLYYARYALTNGVMSANTDITRYTSQVISRNVSTDVNTPTGSTTNTDTKLTRAVVTLDKDFLDAIDWSKSNFQWDIFFQAKRVSLTQGVTNTFEEIINGVSYGSTKVTTNTDKSAIDKLREQLSQLTSTVNKDVQDLADFKSETASNLSVIRKDISSVKETIVDNKSKQDAINSSLASGIATNTDAISKNTDAINANTTAIQNNSSQVLSVKSVVSKLIEVVKDIDSQVNTHETSINNLNKLTEQRLSTLTIYVPSVTTDAEAVQYAINHGVSAGSIKSVTLNDTKHFVVTYNTSNTAINNSKPATQTPVNVEEVAKVVAKIDLYTVKSESEARNAIVKLGYDENSITSVSEKDGVYTVVIDTRLKPTSSTSKSEIATESANTDSSSSVSTTTTASTAKSLEFTNGKLVVSPKATDAYYMLTFTDSENMLVTIAATSDKGVWYIRDDHKTKYGSDLSFDSTTGILTISDSRIKDNSDVSLKIMDSYGDTAKESTFTAKKGSSTALTKNV